MDHVPDARTADRGRIQAHLREVEADLRARAVDHLPPALQQERRRNLDRLHAYWQAGEFPRNSNHPGERVPYFIDEDGVACAVGHLVIASGAGAVAAEIQASENNAKLLAMQHPALPGWIAASGLTAEECARIQPTYCNCGEIWEPVCGVDGTTYGNACEAETCAGVEIAHAGACEAETSTTYPPAGSGDHPSTGEEPESSTGDESGTGGGSSTGEPDSESGEDPPAERKAGCNVDPRGLPPAALALLLAWPRRRVRR